MISYETSASLQFSQLLFVSKTGGPQVVNQYFFFVVNTGTPVINI